MSTLRPFGMKINSIYNQGNSGSRTLGIRDKQILYDRAMHKCEACGKEIDFAEMQTGHKKAASKGGKATLSNSVCLCYKCNKLQGTDSWATFMGKTGKKEIKTVTSRERTDKPKMDKHYGKKRKKIGLAWENPYTGKRIKLFEFK